MDLSLLHDLRRGSRQLLRQPGSSIAATLSLALGIGAVTAIFTMLNAVALRPLPYQDSERLVWVTQVLRMNSTDEVTITPDFLDWRRRNRSFTDLAAFNYVTRNLTGLTQPLEVPTARVSAAPSQSGRDNPPRCSRTTVSSGRAPNNSPKAGCRKVAAVPTQLTASPHRCAVRHTA